MEKERTYKVEASPEVMKKVKFLMNGEKRIRALAKLTGIGYHKLCGLVKEEKAIPEVIATIERVEKEVRAKNAATLKRK